MHLERVTVGWFKFKDNVRHGEKFAGQLVVKFGIERAVYNYAQSRVNQVNQKTR